MADGTTENWEAFRKADAAAREQESSVEALRRRRRNLMKRVYALTERIERKTGGQT